MSVDPPEIEMLAADQRRLLSQLQEVYRLLGETAMRAADHHRQIRQSLDLVQIQGTFDLVCKVFNRLAAALEEISERRGQIRETADLELIRVSVESIGGALDRIAAALKESNDT